MILGEQSSAPRQKAEALKDRIVNTLRRQSDVIVGKGSRAANQSGRRAERPQLSARKSGLVPTSVFLFIHRHPQGSSTLRVPYSCFSPRLALCFFFWFISSTRPLSQSH